MIWIACVEDRMGMSFNGRRVSRDSEITRDILAMCQEKPLYMEESSRRLFEKWEPENLVFTETFMDLVGQYCFIENPDKAEETEVEEVVLYRFNRHYPADRHFSLELENWMLVCREEFPGSSHDNITKEIYRR